MLFFIVISFQKQYLTLRGACEGNICKAAIRIIESISNKKGFSKEGAHAEGEGKKAPAIRLFRATDRTQGESIYNYFTGFIPGQAHTARPV